MSICALQHHFYWLVPDPLLWMASSACMLLLILLYLRHVLSMVVVSFCWVTWFVALHSRYDVMVVECSFSFLKPGTEVRLGQPNDRGPCISAFPLRWLVFVLGPVVLEVFLSLELIINAQACSLAEEGGVTVLSSTIICFCLDTCCPSALRAGVTLGLGHANGTLS